MESLGALFCIIMLPIVGGMYLAARRERYKAARIYKEALDNFARRSVIGRVR